MAQSDLLGIIPNGAGSTVRGGINEVDAAIATDFAGASAPTEVQAWMTWRDTSAGLIKVRNAANSAWLITHNTAASADPGVGDDDAASYMVGSLWANVTGNKVFVCRDPSTGAAVWVEVGSGGAGITTITATQAIPATLPPGDTVVALTGITGAVLGDVILDVLLPSGHATEKITVYGCRMTASTTGEAILRNRTAGDLTGLSGNLTIVVWDRT